MTKGDKWYNYHVADVTKVNAIVTDADGKQYSSEKKLESAASADWYCENGKWSKYNPDERIRLAALICVKKQSTLL